MRKTGPWEDETAALADGDGDGRGGVGPLHSRPAFFARKTMSLEQYTVINIVARLFVASLRAGTALARSPANPFVDSRGSMSAVRRGPLLVWRRFLVTACGPRGDLC